MNLQKLSTISENKKPGNSGSLGFDYSIVENSCFSLNIQNRKNYNSLFSLRNIKIMTKQQKIFFEILVQTALFVGQFWTILKITPKSTLLFITTLWF